jgi:hypothetical protein
LFIPDPDPDFLPIPDPGVKKAPDPGSGSASANCLRMCKILVTFPHLCSHSTIGRTIQRGAGKPTLAATSGPDSLHGREPEESHSISTGFPRSQYTVHILFVFSFQNLLCWHQCRVSGSGAGSYVPRSGSVSRGTDPDPSVIKQKKNLDSYCFVTSKPLIFVVLQVTKLCTLLAGNFIIPLIHCKVYRFFRPQRECQ